LTHISTALPVELAAAISLLLHERPRKALAERTQRISQGFRARKTTRETIRDADDVLAYALSRLPATYAATATVFGKICGETPDFRPKTLLDLGCGLGAASFAAMEVWPDIESVAMLDRSAEFLAMAKNLVRASRFPALANASLVEADMKALETKLGS
jgi:ribosomal protein RSM22 (predicted rRNA methylase)